MPLRLWHLCHVHQYQLLYAPIIEWCSLPPFDLDQALGKYVWYVNNIIKQIVQTLCRDPNNNMSL